MMQKPAIKKPLLHAWANWEDPMYIFVHCPCLRVLTSSLFLGLLSVTQSTQLLSVTGCHRLSLVVAKLACSYLPMTQVWHLFHLLYRPWAISAVAVSKLFSYTSESELLREYCLSSHLSQCTLSHKRAPGDAHQSFWDLSSGEVQPVCATFVPCNKKSCFANMMVAVAIQAFTGGACARISHRPSPQSTWACILCFSSCSLVPVTVSSLQEPCHQTDNYWK